jgi:hypothetical protein
MSTGEPFDKNEFRQRFIEQVANPFLSSNITYATVPEGNLVDLVKNFYEKSEVWFLPLDGTAPEPLTNHINYNYD